MQYKIFCMHRQVLKISQREMRIRNGIKEIFFVAVLI